MRGRCLCLEKEKNQIRVAELLADFARRRRVVIVMLAQAVDTEKQLARDLARQRNEQQARTHLENAARAEADLKRERAVCATASNLLKTIKHAHTDLDLAVLLRQGAADMEQVAADMPDVAALLDQIRDRGAELDDLARPLMEDEEEEVEPELDLELPSVPLAPPQQQPRRERLMVPE